MFAALLSLLGWFAHYGNGQDRLDDRPSLPAAAEEDSRTGRSGKHRPADEIVSELEDLLKASRRAIPYEEFMATHNRIASLVNELRETSPDDRRVARFLPERWLSLSMTRRLGELHSELDEVLRTTSDSGARSAALFYQTVLTLQGPIDGHEAAALAEKFAREFPDDNRSGEMLYVAAGKLESALYIRLVVFVIVGTAAGLAAFVPRKRAIIPPRRWMLVPLLVPLALLAFQVVSHFSLLVHGIQQAAMQATMVVLFLVQRAAEGLWSFVQSRQAAVGMALAGCTALVLVVYRRYSAAASSLRQISAARLGVFGLTATLTVWCAVDAGLMTFKRSQFMHRLVRDYPDSFRGRMVQGQRRQQERIGQTFELEFTDAISGKRISMQDFRGKIVVVDFWATTCGPCVGEVRELKRLYAKYHHQGVEFIGVSQDLPEEDGGLESLRTFVKKEQVPWPQYHENRDGRAILSGSPLNDFSESWGIEGIPTVFLIDAEGRLYSTEARGRLDTLIPKLLRK